MKARREALQGVEKRSATHAGLWLDKFLTDQPEQTDGQKDGQKDGPATTAKATLFSELGKIETPEGYPVAFERRKTLFEGLQSQRQAKCCTAEVEGRMILGLGQKGSAEAGLALEHTWGVPIIPGSALKGLTMAAAHLLLENEEWRKKDKERRRSLALLGGTTERMGSVIFHDAWWIPNPNHKEEKLPIHADVITVHHQEYYNNGKQLPSDMDSPIPIPFASVTGRYFVVVEIAYPPEEDDREADTEELLEAALCILKLGLSHLGIGAKTNAGYGRMKLNFESRAEQKQRQETEAAEREKQRLLAQCDAENKVKTVDMSNAAQRVPELLAQFHDPNDPAKRRALAEKLVEKLTKKSAITKAKEGKPWAVMLLEAAGIEV